MIGVWGGTEGYSRILRVCAAVKDKPPVVTALTFCASWDGLRNSGFLRTLPTDAGIFARFMTMQEKQIIARTVGIQKENWG